MSVSINNKSKGIRSIRHRLIFVFIILSSLPLLIVGTVSFYKSFQAIEQISVTSYSQIADQLNKSIELLFRDGEKFLTIGSSDESIKFLNHKAGDEDLYSSTYDLIMLFKDYRRIFHFDDYIKGIYIIGANGFCVSEKRGLYSLEGQIKEYNVIGDAIDADGEIVILPHRSVNYAAEAHKDEVISLGRVIKKPVTHERLGVVIVDIDQAAFQSLCENLSIGNAGQFYVITQKMQVLYPPNSLVNADVVSDLHLNEIRNSYKGSFTENLNKTREFFVFNTLEKTSWKIIGRVEQKDLMNSAYEIKILTIWLILLSLSLSVLIYIFVSEGLTRPIKKLQSVMKEAENGNFEVRAQTRSQDEIADLCHSFNAMIRKIRELMVLTIEEQEALKKYELKALQAQINPHFLYNSLEAIIWMAEAGNKGEVVQITKNLSSFFRVSLSKGQEWIPVKDEILHVSNYLEIQQMRYRDILRFEIDMDEALYSYTILKILLQPVVENALYHGIKNKRAGGLIRVEGRLTDQSMTFLVKDNGAGINPVRLEEIREALRDKGKMIESRSGFGLKNIYQRLKLYYGDKADMKIESLQGEGTEVLLVLPLRNDLC
jgi:two-component system, sensor histidine kinase YesM